MQVWIYKCDCITQVFFRNWLSAFQISDEIFTGCRLIMQLCKTRHLCNFNPQFANFSLLSVDPDWFMRMSFTCIRAKVGRHAYTSFLPQIVAKLGIELNSWSENVIKCETAVSRAKFSTRSARPTFIHLFHGHEIQNFHLKRSPSPDNFLCNVVKSWAHADTQGYELAKHKFTRKKWEIVHFFTISLSVCSPILSKLVPINYKFN